MVWVATRGSYWQVYDAQLLAAAQHTPVEQPLAGQVVLAWAVILASPALAQPPNESQMDTAAAGLQQWEVSHPDAGQKTVEALANGTPESHT